MASCCYKNYHKKNHRTCLIWLVDSRQCPLHYIRLHWLAQYQNPSKTYKVLSLKQAAIFRLSGLHCRPLLGSSYHTHSASLCLRLCFCCLGIGIILWKGSNPSDWTYGILSPKCHEDIEVQGSYEQQFPTSSDRVTSVTKRLENSGSLLLPHLLCGDPNRFQYVILEFFEQYVSICFNHIFQYISHIFHAQHQTNRSGLFHLCPCRCLYHCLQGKHNTLHQANWKTWDTWDHVPRDAFLKWLLFSIVSIYVSMQARRAQSAYATSLGVATTHLGIHESRITSAFPGLSTTTGHAFLPVLGVMIKLINYWSSSMSQEMLTMRHTEGKTLILHLGLTWQGSHDGPHRHVRGFKPLELVLHPCI